MKIKKYFTTIFFIVSTSLVTAQIVDRESGMRMRMNTRINIEKANFRITYRHIATPDTARPEQKKENIMYLEIGNNISKYIDQQQAMADSIYAIYASKEGDVEKVSKNVRSLLRGSLSEIVLKNYPEGKITVYDRIPFNTYVYEEKLVTPNWQLQNGSLAVCGYACKKATTTFRGRNYTAWYTSEIPISNGPWKFTGLPGLILKVEDDKGHYTMECVGIEKRNNNNDIYISVSKREIKTTKQKFMAGLAEYYKNPRAHIANTGMIQSEIPAHVYQSRPYNPIELSD